MKFSIILSNNERSHSYLNLLLVKKKFPNFVIHLESKESNEYKRKILSLIYKNKLNFKSFNSNNIDNKKVEKFILNLKDKLIIYSGYSGIIIRSTSILKKKKLLHSHSGKLPDFKGSTTIFYSLIKQRKIYCTTLILSNKIDKGKILLIKKYPPLKNLRFLDKYDNKIRALNMLETLNNFTRLNKINKKYKDNFSQYYIIHPVLRYIALKK